MCRLGLARRPQAALRMSCAGVRREGAGRSLLGGYGLPVAVRTYALSKWVDVQNFLMGAWRAVDSRHTTLTLSPKNVLRS